MSDPLYSPEAMLCAALLDKPDEFEHVRWVSPIMFADPVSQNLFVAIEWELRKDRFVTADELAVKVRHLLIEHGKKPALDRLVQLTGAYPMVGSMAVTYAKALHEIHREVALKEAHARTSLIIGSDRYSVAEKAGLIEETWSETFEVARSEPGWAPIGGLSTLNQFMAATEETHEWVIPGMLERQERLMLIAPEKAGKTVLTRQFAMMLAAGRHPLNASIAVPPVRTLLVDLENPAPTARRDLRRQAEQLEGLWSAENDMAWMLHRPAGIHLGDASDRVMLRSVVERLKIDLLCISPIYKAYDGLERSWEEQAFGVQKPLDRLREDYNCAIWMEHHAPWGGERGGAREIRPIGSSRWQRWLDYQVALTPDRQYPPYPELLWKSIKRDERKISPTKIVRSREGASWVAEWEDGNDYGFDLAMHRAID